MHTVAVDIFLSICVGIGLSAACGFRVFVPLLCLGIAAHAHHLQLSPAFAWIGSMPAIIAFSVATLCEIAGYYVPWIDNLLDTVAVPVAAVAGIMATAAVVTDIDPFWKWVLAIVAGGGVATTTQLATTKARVMSSATTGGLGNPVLATFENSMSGVLSVLSVLWPLVAIVVVAIVLFGCGMLFYYATKALLKVFRRKPADIEPITANS